MRTPPSIHVEISTRFKTVMTAASEVKATCLVHTVFDVKVTWLNDGRVSQSNTVNQDRQQGHKEIHHYLFPVIIIQDLWFYIYQWKFLPDLVKGDSVVLVCDVTNLSSCDLSITFQANNVDLPNKQLSSFL